jgi:hypothetical protein
MPVSSEDRIEELHAHGVELVAGSVTDLAGVTGAKYVPLRRLGAGVHGGTGKVLGLVLPLLGAVVIAVVLWFNVKDASEWSAAPLLGLYWCAIGLVIAIAASRIAKRVGESLTRETGPDAAGERRVSTLYARDEAAIAGIEKLRFFPLEVVSDHDWTLATPDGRELLDLSATWTASGLGHGHAGSGRIGDVRGRGLAIGLEPVDPDTGERDSRLAAQVVYRAWELGAVVYYVGGNVLEITPPLVLTEPEASRAVEILGAAIADAAAGKVDAEEVARYAGW